MSQFDVLGRGGIQLYHALVVFGTAQVYFLRSFKTDFGILILLQEIDELRQRTVDLAYDTRYAHHHAKGKTTIDYF